MSSKNSRTITLTLPEGLLAQIDVLAKKDFASRSDILRQAALMYVRKSNLDDKEIERLAPKYSRQRPKTKPKPKPKPRPERKRDQIIKSLKPKHPNAYLYDKELLAFLDDYERGKL